MKRLSGFSLMEMMIVLTIIAIVAAASAPMVNKKMVVSQRNENIWSRAQDRNSIFFNDDGANNSASSVRIGSRTLPLGSQNPRLYIRNRAGIPHMEFSTTGGLNNPIIRLYAGNTGNIWLTRNSPADGVAGSVALGFNARTTNGGVAIGAGANGGNNNASSGSVVIGSAARTENNSENSIVIGNTANAGISNSSVGAISIGSSASADNTSSIAIGSSASADNISSIAIGRLAEATGVNSIAIGSSGDDSDMSSRARATGDRSIAIGGDTTLSSGTDTIVIGNDASAGSENIQPSGAIAIGSQAHSDRSNSVAIGPSARVDDSGGGPGIAIGNVAVVNGDNGIAIGNNAQAPSWGTISIGRNAGSQVIGPNKICIGNNSGPSMLAPIEERESTNEVVYIGSRPNWTPLVWNEQGGDDGWFHNGMIVIDNRVSNERPATKRYANANGPTVYINGNLCVRGYIAGVMRNDDREQSERMAIIGSNGMGNTKGMNMFTDVNFSHQRMSDRRLKNVGKAFVGGLAELKKLDLYNYTFKDDKDKTPRVGVMAQDLQKIFPDAVFKGDDGFLRIRMEDMFYAVINAVKELDLRISSNSKKIEELEKQNQELLKQNEEFIKLNEKCLKQNAELLKRIEALEKAKK